MTALASKFLGHDRTTSKDGDAEAAMFPTLARRLAQPAKEAASKRIAPNIAANPYKTRKVWPPNFRELNHQQQLRFEKKYKRRILLASRSPRWEKAVKYAQLATLAAAMLWLLFYAEFDWWGQKYKPSEEFFGVLNPEKRYERRPDAPPPPPSSSSPSSAKQDPESK